MVVLVGLFSGYEHEPRAADTVMLLSGREIRTKGNYLPKLDPRPVSARPFYLGCLPRA